jgi:hypothetical protein
MWENKDPADSIAQVDRVKEWNALRARPASFSALQASTWPAP